MKKMLKTCSVAIAAALAVGSVSLPAAAEEQEMVYPMTSAEEIQSDIPDSTLDISSSVSNESQMIYLPDVTSEMIDASFWNNKVSDPDKVLADSEAIEKINAAILADEGTHMHDLRNWSEETYDGIALNEALKKSALSDAEYFWSSGVRFDDDGNRYSDFDAAMEGLYKPLIDNCVDPDATETMPVHYGICTTRSCIVAYPTAHPLYDDPGDPDFNYLYLATVRVNEPLIVRSKSADGLYYQVTASSVSGWIAAEDIAICADKEEWLSAWDLPSDKFLVVYGDKIYTEDSNFAPETANRLLSMGTCLELGEDSEELIINRRAYNNYIVYLPVRNEDGSYKKVLSLIGENQKVHVGYLPLTVSNLEEVSLNQLGNTYGWGGMLLSEDCSGYIRNVYKCFGLELARNTTWQAAQPVYKFTWNVVPSEIAAMSEEERAALAEEKAEAIKKLGPGAVLIFNGHEMIYLGEDNGKLYVISSVSDIVLEEGASSKRVRGALINTLDIRRGRGYGYITWLEAIHTAQAPYLPFDYKPDPEPVPPTFKPGWNLLDGSWYYADPDGNVVHGWVNDGINWYYTDPVSGVMETGWVQVNGFWYYMDFSGAMVKGWVLDNDVWYFLKASGAMAENEWAESYWLGDGGAWTYPARGSWKRNAQGWWFGDTAGWFAKNETVKIDDQLYRFNEQGYLE